MKRTGLSLITVLVMAFVLFLPSTALAGNEELNIFSCRPKGHEVVMELVCLDEQNKPVSLPLTPSAWTIRSNTSKTDLQVTNVTQSQEPIHYVFLFEYSKDVVNSNNATNATKAIQSSFDHLRDKDCVSIIRLDNEPKLLIERSRNSQDAKTALNYNKAPKVDTPKLYGGILAAKRTHRSCHLCYRTRRFQRKHQIQRRPTNGRNASFFLCSADAPAQ